LTPLRPEGPAAPPGGIPPQGILLRCGCTDQLQKADPDIPYKGNTLIPEGGLMPTEDKQVVGVVYVTGKLATKRVAS